MTERRGLERRASDRARTQAMWLVAVYIVTVTVTLAISGAYGQLASVIDSFVGIGLVIAIRDRLHALWDQDGALERLTALILIAAVGAFAVNLKHPLIGLASVLAFLSANSAASFAWSVRASATASAVAFAVVDSLIFPTVAFGTYDWRLIAGQMVAKIAGAGVYAWLLGHWWNRPDQLPTARLGG